MNKNRIIVLYLLMLAGHVAHVFEETWGRFWLLNKLGLEFYFIGNWLLFCVPLVLFYFVINNKRWAYRLSVAYAAFMAVQGIGHNIAAILTGKYFDGFAGGFTGIGLFIIGSALVYYLLKGIPGKPISSSKE